MLARVDLALKHLRVPIRKHKLRREHRIIALAIVRVKICTGQAVLLQKLRLSQVELVLIRPVEVRVDDGRRVQHAVVGVGVRRLHACVVIPIDMRSELIRLLRHILRRLLRILL